MEVPATRAWIIGVLAVVLLAGCTGGDGSSDAFVDVADQAGIDYQIDLGLPPNAHPMAFMGGGLAVGDVDDDGDPDFYVADRNQNALYINQGDGTFKDRTRQWNAWDAGVGRAPAFFDYDNDGDLDLFVGNFVSMSTLYRNDGGRFTNVTGEAGVGVRSTIFSTAVADYNGDGYLDLFLAAYGDLAKNQANYMTIADNGEPNWLFRNNGDGTFTDVTRKMGLDTTRWSLASAFSDIDADGDQDLYVANDFGWDVLWVNEGDRFVDRGRELDAVVNRNGMGVTFLDADNDLDQDIYVTNIYMEHSELPVFDGNVLFDRQADGIYREIARQAGVADGGWSWDAEACDLDNDGDQDLYVANGFASRGDYDLFYDAEYKLQEGRPGDPTGAGYGQTKGRYNETHTLFVAPESMPEGLDLRDKQAMAHVSQGGYQENRLFLNDGTGAFQERAADLGANLGGDSRAVACLDHDLDGDMDLLVTEARKNVRLLENRGATGHWLQVELAPGEGRAADAIGARVELTAGDQRQLRTMQGAAGFMSQAEPLLHFGLGNATQVDELVVTWPWGEQTVLEDLEADQRVEVSP